MVRNEPFPQRFLSLLGDDLMPQTISRLITQPIDRRPIRILIAFDVG